VLRPLRDALDGRHPLTHRHADAIIDARESLREQIELALPNEERLTRAARRADDGASMRVSLALHEESPQYDAVHRCGSARTGAARRSPCAILGDVGATLSPPSDDSL